MTDSNSSLKSIPKVAVVNDDVVQLNILCGLLRKADVEPLQFKSAEAALSAFELGVTPALIVTDLYMPGIDGWRFCHLLRSPEYITFNQVPILVVSAIFEGDEVSRITTVLGANSFLPIPVDGKQFIDRIQMLLKGEKISEMINVLIVENDKQISFGLMKSFQAHGFQVSTAFTYKESINLIGWTPYHVAVLEYDLPDGLGDDLMKVIREKFPDCICIMMTGYSRPELALTWIKMGASDYLQKPFDPEYVIAQCERARREHSLMRSRDLLNDRTRQLWESEEKYRSLVQHTSDPIFSFNPDGTYRFANEALARAYGKKPEEIIGKTLYDFFPYDEAERRMELVRHVFNTGEKGGIEGKVIIHTGEERYYLTRIDPVKDEQGKVLYATCTSKDITDRELVEDALGKSEERFRAAISALQEGFVLHDQDGSIVMCNQSVERIMGLKESQLQGRSPLDPRWRTIHEDGSDYPGETHPAMLSLRQGITQYDVIMGIYKPSGELTWVSVNSAPIGLNEKPIGVVVTVVDITQRKQAEEELQESEAHYRAMVEGAPGIIYSFSSKRGGFYYSPRVVDILGYSPDQLINQPLLWHDSIHPEDVLRVDHDILTAAMDKAFEIEYRIKDANGTWHWFIDRSIRFKIEGDDIIIEGLALDITDRKAIETQIQEQLEELNRWYGATLGREERILELKKEVNHLLTEAGKSPRYASVLNMADDMIPDSSKLGIPILKE
ncbi:MAG: PAS domain S-box protein [Chloroflexota bacterium]